MNKTLLGTKKDLESSICILIFFIPQRFQHMQDYWLVLLSKKLAWNVQVHAMTNEAKPNEEI